MATLPESPGACDCGQAWIGQNARSASDRSSTLMRGHIDVDEWEPVVRSKVEVVCLQQQCRPLGHLNAVEAEIVRREARGVRRSLESDPHALGVPH